MLTVDLSSHRDHELSADFGRFEPDQIYLVGHAIRDAQSAAANGDCSINEDPLYIHSTEVHCVQAF